jgi:hypothetical protein
MNYPREKDYTLPRLVLTDRWWAEEAEPTQQPSLEEQRTMISAWNRLLRRSVRRSGELTDRGHNDFDS